MYKESFKDWYYVDLPEHQAETLVNILFQKGAGFATTSEPGGNKRRIYYVSQSSTVIIHAFLARLDTNAEVAGN